LPPLQWIEAHEFIGIEFAKKSAGGGFGIPPSELCAVWWFCGQLSLKECGIRQNDSGFFISSSTPRADLNHQNRKAGDSNSPA
jgi:hypothetical protein